MLSQKLLRTILFTFFVVSILPLSILGATKEELEQKITQALLEKEKVEKEIATLSKSLTDTSKQSQTLKNTLYSLELTRKKLVAELSLTQKNIQISTSNIENLTYDLNNTQKSIQKNSGALSLALVRQNELESESLIETFLKYKSISEGWDRVTNLIKFEREIQNAIITSRDLEKKLTEEKTAIELEKNNLVSYQEQLSSKKTSVDITAQEKSKLLTDTKNKETEYQKLLVEKQKQRDIFEKELFAFESELRITIDPNSIPGERSGVLSWPTDKVYMTQQFGKTSFSRRLYTSGTHNGVDFRATIGTPVKATLSGIIEATGNTDLQKGCYSYGKWILIRHGNGLSSLYGHLSQVNVKKGDTVITGNLIGYSGNTGYSTGPHLHLTILASQGVRVEKFANSKNCRNVELPLADIKAYLDPMAYLPKYP